MSKFDKYRNLFAEQGDLDTPPVVGIGASYKLTDKMTVALDVSHTFYSEIAAIHNEGTNRPNGVDGITGPFPVDQDTNALGKDEGLGFGWDDQTVYKLGASYQYDPKWTFRAGWNYGKSPIPEETEILFNLLAPASTQHHLTLGASYQYSDMIEFSLGYMHAYQFSQNGPTYIGSSGQLGMSQNSFGFNVGITM
jgi:long-chain fatty acid transport protein